MWLIFEIKVGLWLHRVNELHSAFLFKICVENMALAKAHEGYEYQDLLTCYFILLDILQENNSEFVIDRKAYQNDKIDDLSVWNKKGIFKKQFKYSNADSNHTLQKSDLSGESGYGLALDTLYASWLMNPDRANANFRICLAWNEPADELVQLIDPVTGAGSFPGHPTQVFKIKGAALWPEGKLPLSSWRRFRKAAKSFVRDNFIDFTDQLLIEVGMPKFSLDLSRPGDLEKLVLEQATKLGIGVFPNDSWKPETFINAIMALVKRARSKGTTITTASIFHELNIRTDYGSIEQSFPVIPEENIKRQSALDNFSAQLNDIDKALLLGEPGSGKSWFIENFQKSLLDKGIKVVRHYCYTNLDDVLQKERIKVNTFYGNLIADILKAFPELEQFKIQKFASNLKELNLLLGYITQPTYLFIDGLDHIERVASFRSYSDISQQDIAIIESISRLNPSPSVKIIVSSQNIAKLQLIAGFKALTLPQWTQDDVKAVLKKANIGKLKLKGIKLAPLLLEKSAGNPLYLKYLLEEIRRLPYISAKAVKELPPYSFNLTPYYSYLLSRLNMREDVPRVLSGVNFSLTKTELQEITGGGELVSESLNILSPILKVNLTNSGYLIYHESFRRFIIEQLRSKSVSIEKTVFEPVINWFDSKDFFTYRKAYKYYLQFLYEGGLFRKMLSYLEKDFVSKSVLNGQPWTSIEKNYLYLVKAGCYEKDFPKVIILNEIDKIISATEDTLNELFPLYLEALGKIHGFEYVSDYLLFEGSPTVPSSEGLKACYLCDENEKPAPWEQYLQLLKEEQENIEESDFRYYIRGLLVLQRAQALNKAAKKIKADDLDGYRGVFTDELIRYRDREFVSMVSKTYPAIAELLQPKATVISSNEELLKMADEILKLDHPSLEEVNLLENFFEGLRAHVKDEKLFKTLIKKFKARNWFYNWVIYYLKIIAVSASQNPSNEQIKEAFDFLRYNTDPFHGKPRASDLYRVEPFIFRSFQEGLRLIQGEKQWKDVIDILVHVSEKTTVSIRRSIGGPLATDKLIKLLTLFTNPQNIGYVTAAIENTAKEKEEYHLHSDIAEYYLRLSLLFCSTGQKDKALPVFQKAVQYILGYTMRKDMSLYDVLEGLEFYAKVDKSRALEDLKKARVLVDSAVEHTDGKETDYFPIKWFGTFLKVDLFNASLFLRHELSSARFDWRAERSLVDLLVHASGNINPVLESYLALTFPINDSGQFISYCFSLSDKLDHSNPSLAEQLMAKVIPAVQPKQNRSVSSELIEKVNEKIGKVNYLQGYVVPANPPEKTIAQEQTEKSNARKDLSEMTIVELTEYFSEHRVQESDLNALISAINSFKELTEECKELITTIVKSNNKNYPDKIDLARAFHRGDEIEVFYWISRFVLDAGGWFEQFINFDAFKKAWIIDQSKTIAFLFELLPPSLNIGSNLVFSSNLIGALVHVGYDVTAIKTMWQNLFEITSDRLPSQDEIKWKDILEDDLSMSQEEVLICILICRFKAFTSDRYRVATAGLHYLMENEPEKLIKPIKWFFRHRGWFEKSVWIIHLELLLIRKKKDLDYHRNFEEELDRIFPSRYFVIDYIVGQLLNRPINPVIVTPELIYPAITRRQFNTMLSMNNRFRLMNRAGQDLERIFKTYFATYQLQYDQKLEIFWNRMHKKMVSHVSSPEYLLELINTDLYNSLLDWSGREADSAFQYSNLIDIESILAYANSMGVRPSDLPRPKSFKTEQVIIPINAEQQWIRLGHYELELFEKGNRYELEPIESFGGIVFDTSWVNHPHSNYSIFPIVIWRAYPMDFDIEETPVFAILQFDPMECYNILWLNPAIVKDLELQAKITNDGLVAVDENGEPVLKIRCWITDYIGDSFRTVLSDEIPKLVGTELVIKSEYFERLRGYYGEQPPVYKVYTPNAAEGKGGQ